MALASGFKCTVILSLAIILTNINNSFSQFYCGPNIGLNWGSQSIDNQVPGSINSERFGYVLGVTFEYNLIKYFSLSIQPTYIQKGAKVSFPIGSAKVNSDIRVDYLQFPLIAKACLNSKIINPYVFIGPNLGLYINNEIKMDVKDTTQIEFVEMEYQKIDFAFDAGMGFEITFIGSMKYFADFRYSLGLMNIDAIAAKDKSIGYTKNRGLQLQAGVLFKIK